VAAEPAGDVVEVHWIDDRTAIEHELTPPTVTTL
jgi:hypothetical protein